MANRYEDVLNNDEEIEDTQGFSSEKVYMPSVGACNIEHLTFFF